MTVAQEEKARHEAREILRSLWTRRSEFWSISPSLAELVPIPVEIIARKLLGLSLDEPEEIDSLRPGFQTAGLMDRKARRIVAAQKYRHEWRRFTIAHEIAHWILHPDMIYHRDRPLTGAEQSNDSRPLAEQEADKFASELLMPTKVLMLHFKEMFGEPIDGRVPTSELASWLSTGSKQVVSVADLSKGVRYRSMVVAGKSLFKLGSYFPPLAQSFCVSITAMAIQLEDLKLVL